MYQIILASGSPRRKELLSLVGISYQVNVSEVEEITTETVPANVVMELSKMKAEDVAKQYADHAIIIGSDTVVAIGDEILGKPKNEAHAKEMLLKLSGKSHEVYTGVTVIMKKENGETICKTFYEMSKVKIAPLSEQEILDYIATQEPMDKAGAYAIQGKFAAYVQAIEGEFYTIVGLPIARLYKEVKELGVDLIRNQCN